MVKRSKVGTSLIFVAIDSSYRAYSKATIVVRLPLRCLFSQPYLAKLLVRAKKPAINSWF
ncbi:hypothetical protein BCU91_05025 [Shewanella sp. 10N.286.52.B9]|nr:hypothetical protein BCU91_05025 [Shewanella sp. 10N.286.52.B9]